MSHEVNHAELLRQAETECILSFMLTGKPGLAPKEELIFSWCIGQGYIGNSEDTEYYNIKYVITQKGLNHVSM